MALSQWDNLTESEREAWMLKGSHKRNLKTGRRGKVTEDLTQKAVEYTKGAHAWNSNSGTPICDKIVCWKGRMLIVEIKECHDPKLEFSCITKQENTNLKAVEKTNGLGLIAIRYVSSHCCSLGFLVPYTQWMAAQLNQKFKYFHLVQSPPPTFVPFSWANIDQAWDKGERSQFEVIVDQFFAERPLR